MYLWIEERFLLLLFLQFNLTFLYMYRPFCWRILIRSCNRRWWISNVFFSCQWNFCLRNHVEHDWRYFSPLLWRLLLLLYVLLNHFVKVTHGDIWSLTCLLSLQDTHLDGFLVSKQRCAKCWALCRSALRGMFLFRTLTWLNSMELLVPTVSSLLRLKLWKFRKLWLLIWTLS